MKPYVHRCGLLMVACIGGMWFVATGALSQRFSNGTAGADVRNHWKELHHPWKGSHYSSDYTYN